MTLASHRPCHYLSIAGATLSLEKSIFVNVTGDIDHYKVVEEGNGHLIITDTTQRVVILDDTRTTQECEWRWTICNQ